MKDDLGNEVNIGDHVICTVPHYHDELMICEVIGGKNCVVVKMPDKYLHRWEYNDKLTRKNFIKATNDQIKMYQNVNIKL